MCVGFATSRTRFDALVLRHPGDLGESAERQLFHVSQAASGSGERGTDGPPGVRSDHGGECDRIGMRALGKRRQVVPLCPEEVLDAGRGDNSEKATGSGPGLGDRVGYLTREPHQTARPQLPFALADPIIQAPFKDNHHLVLIVVHVQRRTAPGARRHRAPSRVHRTRSR